MWSRLGLVIWFRLSCYLGLTFLYFYFAYCVLYLIFSHLISLSRLTRLLFCLILLHLNLSCFFGLDHCFVSLSVMVSLWFCLVSFGLVSWCFVSSVVLFHLISSRQLALSIDFHFVSSYSISFWSSLMLFSLFSSVFLSHPISFCLISRHIVSFFIYFIFDFDSACCVSFCPFLFHLILSHLFSALFRIVPSNLVSYMSL